MKLLDRSPVEVLAVIAVFTIGLLAGAFAAPPQPSLRILREPPGTSTATGRVRISLGDHETWISPEEAEAFADKLRLDAETARDPWGHSRR